MDRDAAPKEIMALLERVVVKYNTLERYSARSEAGEKIYSSERQMIDAVGGLPPMNVTDLARASGVTKGAVSQAIKKLEAKGLLRRVKRSGNAKEKFIELTEEGRTVYKGHRLTEEETTAPLIRELERQTDDKVEFLIRMLKWFDWYLELSKAAVKREALEDRG